MRTKILLTLYFIVLSLLPSPETYPAYANGYSVTAEQSSAGVVLTWKGEYDAVAVMRVTPDSTHIIAVLYAEDGNTITIPNGGIDINYIFKPGDIVRLQFYTLGENTEYLGSAEAQVPYLYYLPMMGRK